MVTCERAERTPATSLLTCTDPLLPVRPMAATVPQSHAEQPRGLSETEAAARRERGLGNDVAFAPSRSYRRILRDNALTSINIIIFAIGVVLVLMGLFGDALVTVGLVLLNVLIAVVQEARAKRALDRIALLTRPKAVVVRDGLERAVDPAEIVAGDLLVANPGDQFVVDGRVVADGRLDVDESLLTGESEPVAKRVGDPVYSGSFCVTGRAVYEAERVGTSSLANQLTARARAFRQVKTPVQREIDLILRVMVILILVIGGPIVLDLLIRVLGELAGVISSPFAARLDRAYQAYSVRESVRAAAVVVGLVPQGLALMLTVTYAMGALRLAGKQALLQQANGIESLSHVDVLCLDKTGTLTTNRLVYHDIQAIGTTRSALAAVLGDVAAGFTVRNRTADAIAAAFPGTARRVVDEVPFSSERKWSALAIDDRARQGVFVLGAPEVLLPFLRSRDGVEQMVASWTATGLRVVLLAAGPKSVPLHGRDGIAALPPGLVPLGLISFRDELQPNAQATIDQFEEAGIQLKIISGDHPDTVAALARQAGFGEGRPLRTVSGLDLAKMDDVQFGRAAEEGEVFGRTTPEQKLDLIKHLQNRGHYVAMIGDGVNDVLALKQAHVGVAMEGGSQATRAVADLVLLGDSFAALPAAFREGQRIVRGTQDLIKLFVARSLSVAIAILGAGVVGAGFPVMPKHNAIPAFLVVGLPTLALAAWARPGPAPRNLLRSVLPFALPAALTMGAIEGILYLTYLRTTDDVMVARTVMTTVAVLCGLLLIPFVQPPTEAWTGGDELSGDRRPTLVALAMLALFAVIMAVPSLRATFELAALAPLDVAVIGVVVAIWAFSLRFIWRHRLLERALGLLKG